MHALRTLLFLAVAIAALAAAPAPAQVLTALLQEGQPLPGGPADHVVDAINNPAVNHSGGYTFNVNTSDGVATLGRFWGHPTGGDGYVLRTEGTFGAYEQTSFESFYGLGGGGAIAYSPMANNLDSGSTGLDGVWVDDAPVAVEEEVYPWEPGYWWSFGSRPGITEDGIPYFVGGITDVQGGSTDNRGLFYGLDAQPLLLGGQTVPGVDAPLATANTVSFDERFSALGTHYLAEVETTEPTGVNNYMVYDGAALVIEGGVVAEGRPVPAAAGGLPGENWDNFDFAGVAESGHLLLSGDTDAATAVDEILVVDGHVVLREGDLVSGLPLTGSISGAYLNEDGDWAVQWDVVTEDGAVDALIFNGEIRAIAGDVVDLDGDGVPEPGATLAGFTGISALVLGDRDAHGVAWMYFTADVDVVGRAGFEAPAAAAASPEEAGIEGEISEPQGDRLEIEMGLCLPSGEPIPVFLQDFTATARQELVEIAWAVGSQRPDVAFRLVASDGAGTREVAHTSAGARFSAVDRPAAGEVTYTLLMRVAAGPEQMLGQTSLQMELPALGVQLVQAAPNPFNPLTTVTFSVHRTARVRLAIYDAGGRLVTTLAEGTFAPGSYDVPWNAASGVGQVASGTYLARLESDAAAPQVTKLMLVK